MNGNRGKGAGHEVTFVVRCNLFVLWSRSLSFLEFLGSSDPGFANVGVLSLLLNLFRKGQADILAR